MFTQDTPSIRDVVAEATESVETQTEAVEETVQPIEPEASEVQTEEQAEELEKFTEDKDLTGLTPEQLLAEKKEWERAYTKKRQEEKAELRRMQEEIEAYKSQTQAPAQTLNFDQERAYAVQDLRAGRITPDQYTETMRHLLIEEAKLATRQEREAIKEEEIYEKEVNNQEQAYQQFVSSDPRLDDNNPSLFNRPLFLDVKTKLGDALDEYFEQNGTSLGFDVKSITGQLIADYDAQIDELVKTRTQQSVQASKMREAKSQKGAARGSTAESSSVGGTSIRDMLSQTVDELGN